MTAQPPGIRPSALRVATHGQQVASLGGWGSYPSAEVQLAYSTAPADRAFANRLPNPLNKKFPVECLQVSFLLIRSLHGKNQKNNCSLATKKIVFFLTKFKSEGTILDIVNKDSKMNVYFSS